MAGSDRAMIWDDFYDGREQSKVKHVLLKHYVRDAAIKVAQSGHGLRAINYVDAFSGPWKNRDAADFTDTSFGLAVQSLHEVRDALSKLGKIGLTLRVAFCESDPKTFPQLQAAVNHIDTEGMEVRCFNGRFEDRISDIGDFCKKDFTFTFIDPTSWTVGTSSIVKFLNDRPGEFIWNFISDHANRFVDLEAVEHTYRELLDSDNWRDEVHEYREMGFTSADAVFEVLRERLKAHECARYIADFPVQRPVEQRVCFRLAFGTHHLEGLKVFRSAAKKASVTELEVRVRLAAQGSNQTSIFSPEQETKDLAETYGGDGRIHMRKCESAVLAILKAGPSTFKKLIPGLLENFNVTEPGVAKLLNAMKTKKQIEFTLPNKHARRPQAETLISLGAQTTMF